MAKAAESRAVGVGAKATKIQRRQKHRMNTVAADADEYIKQITVNWMKNDGTMTFGLNLLTSTNRSVG